MSSIYPEYYKGKFRLIKDVVAYFLLFIYFAASWLTWNRGPNISNQAIHIDLAGRKMFVFEIQIWANEVYYIMAILILSALALFIVTSLWGRIWCGYACPQTVFTDIFVKIERFWQGDRNARIKLNEENNRDNNDSKRLYKKGMTYISWLAVSFLFAYGWVCYFYGSKELTWDILNFNVTTNGIIWLFSLTCSTYLFAAILRDKVCIFMCPYGRFQSAMIDKNTMLVTYRAWRGEPRGYAVKNDETNNINKKFGDCIDCFKCVFACPMGIDIRNGLQMACINCGLCIDACDGVMKKLHRQTGLIAYDNLQSPSVEQDNEHNCKSKTLQIKALLYGVILLFTLSITIYSLMTKSDFMVTVNKMQDSVFVTLPDNSIRNEYILKMENRSYKNRNVSLMIESDSAYGESSEVIFAIQSPGPHALEYVKNFQMILKPEEEITLRVFVKISSDEIKMLRENKVKDEIRMSFVMNVNDSLKLEDEDTIRKSFVFNF